MNVVDSGYINGRMETFMKVNFRMIFEMDMGRWFGLMVKFIQATGKKVFSMVKDKLESI